MLKVNDISRENKLQRINNKILKATILLDDEELLEKYINTINIKDDYIPEDLSNTILKKVNLEKSKKENKYKKYLNMYSILKIAACTIFAIIIWYNMPLENNLNFIKSSNLEINVGNQLINTINLEMSGISEKVTSFFTVSNFGFEGGK